MTSILYHIKYVMIQSYCSG